MRPVVRMQRSRKTAWVGAMSVGLPAAALSGALVSLRDHDPALASPSLSP
jgi:hypothetical protein